MSLLDQTSHQVDESVKKLQRERAKDDVLSMEELIAISQPLQGPSFDPETHIEDWSDDSSDEEEEAREKTEQELFDELLGVPLSLTQNQAVLPLRRSVAAIYMPIRVNCLYG